VTAGGRQRFGHERKGYRWKEHMSNRRIGVNNQEARSIVPLLASAEKELSAFVAAVHQLFGTEQAWKAAGIWIVVLKRADWPSVTSVIEWRRVTISAAAGLASHDKGQLSRN
jgi:hypothetical protein